MSTAKRMNCYRFDLETTRMLFKIAAKRKATKTRALVELIREEAARAAKLTEERT